MRIRGFIWGLCLLAASCGEAPPEAEAPPEQEVLESVTIPPPIALNTEARQLTEAWPEFRDWSERMERILETEEEEELKLLTEETLELTKALEASKFPELADRSSVRSRVKVVKTFLLQLEADFHYRLDYRFSIKRMAEAYNALRGQLNRLPALELDPKIFER